jgi:signal transduction histidine kinase
MFDDFNAMAAELASVETLKTDFISSVSHEIKTPIATILNYAQTLDQCLDDETLTKAEKHQYAKTVMEASLRLSTLITNILRLNKLENQKITPEVKPFNLVEEISRSILLFDEPCARKNIDLDADFPPESEIITVNFDSTLLDLVWNNLLSNAVKFTPEGGQITVGIQPAEGTSAWVEVSVADTGCGMNDETRRRVFEKFYQGDTSRATEGNGLGLALVKKIVSMAGGQISVESGVGRGSVFTVRLPAARTADNAIEK